MIGYSVVKVRVGESVPHYIAHSEGVMDRLFLERIQNRHFSSKRWGRKCSLLTSRLRGCFLTLFLKAIQNCHLSQSVSGEVALHCIGHLEGFLLTLF